MKTPTPPRSADFQALEEQLALYGPDLQRWPVADQQRFIALLATNAAARYALGEAQALESLLTEPAQADPAFRVRVMDALAAELAGQARRDTSQPSGVAAARAPPLSARASSLSARASSQSARARVLAPPRLLGGRAQAALAASLILGMLAGATGIGNQVVAPISTLAWVAPDDGLDAADMALGTSVSDLDEENAL